MGKRFFDVFPTLKVKKDIESLFEEVEVTKVATTSSKTYLKIHLLSRHLISKYHIFQMEDLIKEQLFFRMPITIHILEKFELSTQYTPENLLAEYKDSILTELKRKSVVEYNMFLNAKCRFEHENILCVQLEDTIVSHGKQDEIIKILKEVFNERCQIPVEVRIEYEKVEETKHRKYNELKLQQEINAIVEGNESRKSESPMNVQKSEEKKTEEKKEFHKKPSGEFKKQQRLIASQSMLPRLGIINSKKAHEHWVPTALAHQRPES